MHESIRTQMPSARIIARVFVFENINLGDTHDMHDMHDLDDMHDTHDMHGLAEA